MHRVLCSTGALIGRPNGRNFRLLAEAADRIEADGFEFMFYDDWYPDPSEVVGYIVKSGLDTPVLHVEKSVGELLSGGDEAGLEKALSLFETNCRAATGIGARTLVLPPWNGVSSDRKIENNLAAFALLRDIALKHSLLLTVENVVCAVGDPLSHLKTLSSLYPDISFTFDTKMAQFHGRLAGLYSSPPGWAKKHIAHVHVNDYRGAVCDWQSLKTLHPGDGDVDFAAFFAYLRGFGYSGDFTVEATSFDNTGRIDYDRLNRSLDFVRKSI